MAGAGTGGIVDWELSALSTDEAETAEAKAGHGQTENTILDAAAACVLAYGVRRTSLSDVARQAKVSRPTVYRRWPDRRGLVAHPMTQGTGGGVQRGGQ